MTWLFFLATTTSIITGCSLSTEDTRITFCRDLTLALSGDDDSLVWTGKAEYFQPAAYAAITLKFESASGTSGSAICFYAYDVPEENAMTQSRPLTAHASIPYKMELNGEPVPQDLFREAVSAQQRNILLRFVDKFMRGADDSHGRTENTSRQHSSD